MQFSGFMAIALALTLGACGEPGEVASDTPAEPAKSVMRSEAEKVCAEVTNYSLEKLQGKAAENLSRTRREYDLCVKSVSSEESLADEVPALRGRTSAP